MVLQLSQQLGIALRQRRLRCSRQLQNVASAAVSTIFTLPLGPAFKRMGIVACADVRSWHVGRKLCAVLLSPFWGTLMSVSWPCRDNTRAYLVGGGHRLARQRGLPDPGRRVAGEDIRILRSQPDSRRQPRWRAARAERGYVVPRRQDVHLRGLYLHVRSALIHPFACRSRQYRRSEIYEFNDEVHLRIPSSRLVRNGLRVDVSTWASATATGWICLEIMAASEE